MKNLKCSMDKAMDILEIPVESRGYYKKNGTVIERGDWSRPFVAH